jgi:hypothetical protein
MEPYAEGPNVKFAGLVSPSVQPEGGEVWLTVTLYEENAESQDAKTMWRAELSHKSCGGTPGSEYAKW